MEPRLPVSNRAKPVIWTRVVADNLLRPGNDLELRQDHPMWICSMNMFASMTVRGAYSSALVQATCRPPGGLYERMAQLNFSAFATGGDA